VISITGFSGVEPMKEKKSFLQNASAAQLAVIITTDLFPTREGAGVAFIIYN